MASKRGGQGSNRRYFCQDDGYPHADGFQGRSLLLEKGLNFSNDQRVFIFSVVSIHQVFP
jgi:hypothetical protein